jgi:hypothetical protein
MDQRTHNSAQTQVQVGDPAPQRNHNHIKTQHRWNGGPKRASGRPPGLPQAIQSTTTLCQDEATVNRLREQIRGTVQRSVATWQDPQAGRPHFEVAQPQA